MHLAIVGSGMVTPVGFQAPSSCAAIRCGLDGFQQTRFEFDRAPLRAAAVPIDGLSMMDKLTEMAVSAIDQCMTAAHPASPQDTAIALCVAEMERPGRQVGLSERFLKDVCSGVGDPARLGPRQLFQSGAIGAIEALLWVERVFEGSDVGHCLVVGVDSYLSEPTLTALHAAGRLLTATNSDGFIPGEAAAGILISRASGAPVAVECRGVGWGREKALRKSGLPLRADGLSQAYRAAFKSAGFGFPGVDYRIADVGGDHYAFKEAALALQRTMRVRKEAFYIWHPADCVGNVGAASATLAFGLALDAARRFYSPGPGVLCHFAADDGVRAAVVLRERDTRAHAERSPLPRVGDSW